ncbi:MAG: hypothetical protein AAGA38_14765 [Pseudomonadota bacterium]
MKFVLTYQGSLKVGQNRRRGSARMHSIRRQFHAQLKELWESDPFLSNWISSKSELEESLKRPIDRLSRLAGNEDRLPVVTLLPDFYRRRDFRFVPLVRADFLLQCSLKILFLRRDPPGSVVSHGDIDNRLKVLLDGLSMPQDNQIDDKVAPGGDEDPFFVLLEDDKLLSAFSVETQRLLEPSADQQDDAVKLSIEVEVKPTLVTMDNASFT